MRLNFISNFASNADKIAKEMNHSKLQINLCRIDRIAGFCYGESIIGFLSYYNGQWDQLNQKCSRGIRGKKRNAVILLTMVVNIYFCKLIAQPVEFNNYMKLN